MMKAKDKDAILEFINGKITENQKEMAAANAAGDNKVYFTSVGVRLAFETLREYINDFKEE